MADDNKIKNSKSIEENSSIKYSGSVVVKYVSKSGKQKTLKRHNKGKPGLFKYILYCLASKSSQAAYLPISIMCYTNDTSGYTTDGKCLTQTQPAKGTPYVDILTDPDNPSITYCFDIPNNNIIKSNSSSIGRLVLVNQKYNSNSDNNPNDSICAEIILNDDDTIATDTNDNIVIYWKLSFSNNEKDTVLPTKKE